MTLKQWIHIYRLRYFPTRKEKAAAERLAKALQDVLDNPPINGF